MTISDTQEAIREAALLIGQEFGLGGATWQVWRGELGNQSQIGTIALRVKRGNQTVLRDLVEGLTYGVESWHAIAAAGVQVDHLGTPVGLLAIGDELRSAEDATLRYVVAAPVRVAGYQRWIVEVAR